MKLPALSIQKPPVFCNFHLQSCLDIKECLVRITLVFNVTTQLCQLFLQSHHLHLESLELHGIPGLCVR